MGVHGLWELLSPVGRRVSVETLAGKKLAIDASIWMIQFMKAMRDERGEMVRNAHILGFFRRICKLLFLRTKPVFVFDGATPALKRRTLIARRRQRENAQAKIRKTAEKLLLNHLKAMRLKELANNLENQRKENGIKGKRVITNESDIAGTTSKMNPPDSKDFDQEALDAMLAASIEAEEGGGFIGDASTSGAGVPAEDEDGDGDDEEEEEMLLPTLQGKVDPAVLAALPPSMQLDLLVQMRERLMAENRQKYQKVKKAPARFSELQIQAYLKTVAFRREINEVQKAAGGRGVNGVQTSRIASEANREFIFSSSFTGNRQSFASSGIEASSSMIPAKHSSTGSVNGVVSTNKSKSAIESIMNEPRKALNEDIQTYKDERGRVRVSKVRAMGIRMTRDLQRNLDLMKEIEQHRVDPSEFLESFKQPGTSHQENDEFVSCEKTNQGSLPVNGTSIEVSFEDDNHNEQQSVDSDDDVFARIVAGDDNTSSVKQPSITLSDCEWEEGVPGEINEERASTSDESEVEWEEGPSDNPRLASACEVEYRETASKGDLLEEADFQEAIRRSMDDMRCQKATDASSASEEFKENKNITTECAGSVPEYLEKNRSVPISPSESVLPQNRPSLVHVREENVDEMRINKADNSPSTQLEVTTLNDQDFLKVQLETLRESDLKHQPDLSIKDASDDQDSQVETGHVDMVNPMEENGVELSNKLHEDISNLTDIDMPDDQQHEFKTPVIDHVTETLEPKETAVRESKADFDIAQKVTDKRDRKDAADKSVLADMSNEQVEITKASLEVEMTNLTKERTDLGDEQRRLERNAESVSGEMFAECQELLQMFGLPYIIAPMEAEAQCAYMELENLVDGVVTDDSDVFLFGARNVYKNIFDDRKYVETYFMKDIETELGLTREKLIRMAMLLGSDYTEGISGIGIVNAVEVLNAFPEEDGLHKFRERIESPDPTILGKIDTRKRGSNSNAEGASTANQGVLRSNDDIESVKQIFMDKHRNVSKNWHIPSTFPSEAVVSAYAFPQVDKSTEPFSWGKPDLFVLRKLCLEKFGWGTQKADELLQPVLKEYNKHETQLRLEAFYTFNERFAKIRSKRIGKAVKGIAGSKTLELIVDNELHTSNGKKRRKVKNKEVKDDVTKEQIITPDEPDPIEKSESSIQWERTQNTKERSRGRGRGRGRGRSAGRGRTVKNNSNLELSGTSSDDGNGEDMQDMDVGHFKGQHEVRKSKRVRKSVTYTNNEDSENDEPTTQEDHAEAVDNEPVATGAGGSNDHEFVLSGVGPGQAELDKDWCQNDISSPGADYLKMGGGFCLDEDEGGKEPFSPAGELTEPAGELTGPTSLVVAVSQGEVEEDENATRPVSFLSGIPNLRRKRKNI